MVLFDGKSSDGLTNGGLTELLVCNLVGDVGPHQHTDFYLQFLSDDVRDQLQTLRTLVDALDEEQRGRSCFPPFLLPPSCLSLCRICAVTHSKV